MGVPRRLIEVDLTGADPQRDRAGLLDIRALDMPAQPGYPWTLRLATRYEIGTAGLTITHEATNLASTPAPFGLGTHP